ncbi:MAG: hypothetical protein EAZ92_07055 [Candidatus Kapaibacterium sp.]|nr:MAG: hypothetical protein EAZ92_07055 [Candidatus Kapabacteria bacterium]
MKTSNNTPGALIRGFVILGAASFCAISLPSCSDTQKQTAQTEQQSVTTQTNTPQDGAASTTNAIAETKTNAASNTLTIYEATVIIAPKKPFPEKFCGKFPVQELVRTLYTQHLKPDASSTLTIKDMLVEPLGNEATPNESPKYIAIVKTVGGENNDGNCSLDIFTFREGNVQPVIAHLSYNPDFEDVDLKSVTNQKYRIAENEFALAVEWKVNQSDAQHTQQSTMLSLFRIHHDTMIPLFELATSNIIKNNAVGSEEFENITDDTATLETMNTWGKELYSLLVARTVTRKSTLEGDKQAETQRTKTLYQWDGERYVETNQLL